MQLRQFISKLTPRGWLAVGGAVAIAIVFLVVVMQVASAPSYSTLLAGQDPAQIGKITSALDAKGISYQIQNNGTALAVQPSQTAQARIALASAGLLTAGSSQPLSTAINTPMGASNQQQALAYQAALEQQLGQTIGQIQGVTGAQVQLVLPNQQDQLFGDSSPASAAVLLSDSGALDPNSVRGIAQLVANSVPNLSLNKVTITDSTGAMLWPSADSAGGAGGGLLAKQAAEQKYDAETAAQVNAMLAQTLGAGKAVVQVNADLNVNQQTQDTLAYTNKGVAAAQSKDVETLNGTGAGASGAAGTASNVPGVAGNVTGGGTSKYNHSVTNTTFDVGKTITHTDIAPGAINRQSVSILFDKSVPAAAQQAILASVKGAVGFNQTRGDSVSYGTMAFVKAPTIPTATPTSKLMGYAKYGLVGLGGLFFLFFVGRMVRKREREALTGEPTWLRELEVARPLPALAGAPKMPEMAPVPDQPTAVIPLTAPVNVARRQVEDLVERDSDRVAQQLRAWMSED